MNDLDLPPRRTLPPEVRDRIRTTVNAEEKPRSRYKAPLSVAAAVAVLAAGAVVISQSIAGTSDGHRAGTTPDSSVTVVPGSDPELTVTQPNAQSDEDLDLCWAAVAASPQAGEFAPRETWQPVFTVTRARPGGTGGLLRVTAFREHGDKPGFCEVFEVTGPGETTSWGATVSSPSAEPIPLAASGGADIHAVYFSHGLMAGVAQGVDSVKFDVRIPHPDTGEDVHYSPPPVVQDGLFFVEIGGLSPGTAIAGGHPGVSSTVSTTGLDGDGTEVTSGEWPYDEAKDPLTGPSKMF
jgi:hypothetical protein